MSKLLTLLRVARPVGVTIGAFYLGIQSGHVVKRAEHNLLRSHLEYAENSHRGSLGFEEVENSRGQLEQKLKNLDTGELIYAVEVDYLPDNGFIYQGLAGRVESSDEAGLRQMREHSRRLEALLKNKLYGGMPVNKESVNPLKLDVNIRANVDGELEAVLRYGNRAVTLTREDFDYLARNGTQLAQEAGLVPVQAANPGCQADVAQGQPKSGGTTYLYLGILGILAVSSVAYKRAREKYPV